MRLFAPLLASVAAGVLAVVPPSDKPRVLSDWTRTSAASYDAWADARARYTGARKASCLSTAWTYYQAVKTFGVGPTTAAPGADAPNGAALTTAAPSAP